MKGNIQNITDFGIFVQVDEGLDGLVHLSDIDWKVPGDIAIKDYSVGQEIEAQILDFEKFLEDKNISLDFSLSRLVENPELVTKSLFKKITKEQYKIQSRMNDIGSKLSFKIFEEIKSKAQFLEMPLKSVVV